MQHGAGSGNRPGHRPAPPFPLRCRASPSELRGTPALGFVSPCRTPHRSCVGLQGGGTGEGARCGAVLLAGRLHVRVRRGSACRNGVDHACAGGYLRLHDDRFKLSLGLATPRAWVEASETCSGKLDAPRGPRCAWSPRQLVRLCATSRPSSCAAAMADAHPVADLTIKPAHRAAGSRAICMRPACGTSSPMCLLAIL